MTQETASNLACSVACIESANEAQALVCAPGRKDKYSCTVGVHFAERYASDGVPQPSARRLDAQPVARHDVA